ncbi:MAG: S41 family peptidase, partial [Myxococcales bacterium]
AIVFENAGYLYLFDLATQEAKKLTLQLPGDRELARPRWAPVKKLITDFDIAPDGKRAVFTARGDIFTVPAKEGSIRDITRTPGIREKYAAWSPDGRWIAYFSDRTGEDELYLSPQDGVGGEIRITTDGKVFRLPPAWSPDSRKLLFADKDAKLFYVDIDQRKPVLLDQGHYDDLTDYSWSPDSKWVTYAKAAENRNNVIYLREISARNSTAVTDDSSASSSPVFDPEGKFLYFLSNRDFNEVLGVFDTEFSNPKAGRVYVATLRADEPSPLPVLSDEVTTRRSPDVLLAPSPLGERPTQPPEQPPQPAGQGTRGEAGKTKQGTGVDKTAQEKKQEEEQPPGSRPLPKNFRIDLDGIQRRIVGLPIPPGNLQNLGAAKGVVYYVSAPVTGLSGPLPGETSAIHGFDLKSRKDHVVLEGGEAYALSFDGRKLLYSAGASGDEPGGGEKTYGIVDAKVPGEDAKPPEPKSLNKPGDGALKLDAMRMEVDPPAEWRQIFSEVWRQERDYFFEPSMNGVDWAKERDKYAQLLPHVADRLSLTYVLGELIGELSNSHTYVGGGDYPNLDAVNVGLLGADLSPDKGGYYKIAKIYPGENWDRNLRSPLTEPGVNVKEGEYLLAVNGTPLKAPQNPYRLFIDTVNQATTLTVNGRPSFDGARNVVVRPIPSEFGLHELAWIETNRRKVEKESGGRIGYVYLPDMGGRGLNAFVKQYFPQIRKQGMIVDVRYNGGGFVDQLIFERLRRSVAAMDSARNWDVGTVPDNTFHGAMACLTNHYAASDGDLFSYFWKVYKLGPLIGERTWGGVRGIRGNIPLMDGGYVTRPEFALYGLDSKWLIENRGVTPDVEVDNRPDLVMAGHDPQLETAIRMVTEEMQKHPKNLPPRPPDLPAYPQQ